MRNGLDDARVESEGRFDEILAVARYATALHDRIGARRPAGSEQLAQSLPDRSDRGAVVGRIVGEKQLLPVVERRDLRRRGTGVDAERYPNPARRNRHGAESPGVPLPPPSGMRFFIFEDGGKRLVRAVAPRRIRGDDSEPFVRRAKRSIGSGERRTPCRQQLGIGGADRLRSVQMQVLRKRLTQRREECQRPAAKKYRSLDVAAMRQRYDGLHRHGVENRSGDLLPAHVFGQQVLDVRFGENAAPRGNRMNADGPLRQTVESGGRRVEQERHLVDKGPRTAGAIAVHAHVRRFAFQENDFGVLAADVDEGRRLRMVTPDIGRRSHDLLNERDLRALRDAQPDRTGNRQTEQFVPEPLAQLRKDDGKSFPNTGIVTNIGRKTNVVVVVQYDDLERRGTHIKTYSIVFHNKTIFHQHCLTIMSDTNVNKNSDMVNRNENYLQFFQRPVVRSVIPKIYTNGRPIQKRYPPQMQRVSPVFRQCLKPPSVKL